MEKTDSVKARPLRRFEPDCSNNSLIAFTKSLSLGQKHKTTIVFSVNRVVGQERHFVGGFADRMKGLINAFYLAYITNSNFYIDWQLPVNLTDEFSPRSFSWELPNALHKQLKEHNCERFDLIDKNYEKLYEKTTSKAKLIEYLFSKSDLILINCNRMDLNLVKLFPTDFQSNLYMLSPSLRVPKLIASAFDLLFQYSPSVLTSALYKKIVHSVFRNKCVVGVHMRIGGSEGGWVDPQLDSLDNIESVYNCLKDELCKRQIEDFLVYFCSDSDAAKQRFKKNYGHQLPIYCTDVPIAHIERSEIASAKIGFSFACLESSLLAQCDFIVCGAGGFATLSAWINAELPINYNRLS